MMFSWVQKKLLNGRSRNKKPSFIPPPADQNLVMTESDWPNGFLAIGTFGLIKSSIKEDDVAVAVQEEEEVVEDTTSSTPTTTMNMNMIMAVQQISKDTTGVMDKNKSLSSYLLIQAVSINCRLYAIARSDRKLFTSMLNQQSLGKADLEMDAKKSASSRPTSSQPAARRPAHSRRGYLLLLITVTRMGNSSSKKAF